MPNKKIQSIYYLTYEQNQIYPKNEMKKIMRLENTNGSPNPHQIIIHGVN